MSLSALRGGAAFGVLAAFVTLAIWTSWIVGTRAAVGGVGRFSPAILLLLRFGVATVILAPVLWRMRLIPRGARPLALIGLMFSGAPYIVLVAAGLRYAPVADVGPLLPGTIPLMVAALSAALFGERFSGWRKGGLALIALGVAAILAAGGGQGGEHALLGHLLILAGALSWAIYTVALRASGLTGLEATAFVAFWSLVVALPFVAPALPADVARAAGASPGEWAAQIAIQGVLAGFVALLTFAAAVRRIGPSRTSAITGLTPVTAMLAAIPVMGEIPTPVQGGACLVIVLGVALATGALAPRARA